MENTTLCEPFVLLIKIDEVFLIRQSLLDDKCYFFLQKMIIFYELIYGPHRIVPECSLSNIFEKTKKKQNGFCKEVIENPWKDNVVRIIFHTLDQNLLKILSK